MSTKKTTKKKTKPTPKKRTKPRRAGASPLSTVTAGIAKFRREDIPGIIPTLKDMKDPHVFAAEKVVPLSALRALQVTNPGMDMMNDFEVAWWPRPIGFS
jgi:hypothetical protein